MPKAILKILKNKWLIRSIGIIIFILILIFKIDFQKLSQIVKINYYYLIGALAVLLLSALIRPIRWQYILKKLSINYSFKKTFQLYYIGVLMGNMTPGKLGEFGKIVYLKNDGHKTSTSLTSILIDKIADMIFLMLAGGIGVLLLSQFTKINILPLLIIIAGLILLLIIIKTRAYKTLVKKMFLAIVPKRFQRDWQAHPFQLNYLAILAITIIYWLSHYLIMYLLAKSVGIHQLSFLYLAISITVVNVVILLPISILGIGTRDISLLFIFSLFEIPPELTISFSILVLSVVIINSFIGLLCWFKNPISITR